LQWLCEVVNHKTVYGPYDDCINVTLDSGRAMAQAVSRRSPTAEARVRSRVSPCGICGGQSGTGTGFSPNTSAFPCQFHSTGASLLGRVKKTDHLSVQLHHRVAQYPIRLRCFHSFCCGNVFISFHIDPALIATSNRNQ
jgi:hypothetical protein